MRTLDSMTAELPEISLLKIDVQGFEKAVLAGATQSLGRTTFLLIELNYMPQYVGGSWFGDLHQILTEQHPFVLVDASKPLRLNGRASMSDGLYLNTARLPASRIVISSEAGPTARRASTKCFQQLRCSKRRRHRERDA